jgi:hypothetical protein
MSHHKVSAAIEALLSDEPTRLRFAVDPFQTFADLGSRGVALTPEEMDALMGADPTMWFWPLEEIRGRFH